LKSKVIGVVLMLIMILATVVTTIVITFDQCLIFAPSQDNILHGTSDDQGNSYMYYESEANVGVYKLSDNDKLMAFVTETPGKAWDGGKVLDLSYSSRSVYLAVRNSAGLKLYIWNDELADEKQLLIPLTTDVVVSSVFTKGDQIIFSTIEDDGSRVTVYSTSGKNVEPISIQSKDAPEGLRFLDANYQGETLETLLSDGTRSAGYYNSVQEEKVLPEKVSFMGVTMGFTVVARNVVIMAAIIFIIAFFFRSVVFRRNYVWLRIYGFMIIVSLCLSAAVYIMSETVSESRIEDRKKEAEYLLSLYSKDMENYDASFGSDVYNDTYAKLNGIQGTSSAIKDLCITTISNERALVNVSTKIPYGDWLADLWGEAVDKCVVRAHAIDSPVWDNTIVNGIGYLTVAVPLNDSIVNRPFVSALIPYSDIEAENASDLVRFFIYMAMVWGVALLIIVFVSFKNALELRKISKMLMSVARGEQKNVKKPLLGSRDYDRMWSAVAELSKGMGKSNYIQNQALVSLARFAPLDIEKLLGKESLADVRLGDRGALDGTVAMIEIGNKLSSERNDFMELMNTAIETICRHREEYSGVLVSDSTNMCSSRMFFPNDKEKAISFGVRTSEALKKSTLSVWKNSFILLHKTRFEYGIMGSADQNFACFRSPQIDLISSYVPELMDLGLRVVASEEVVKGHTDEFMVRFIGSLETAEGIAPIKLYEVLDAVEGDERRRKKETAPIFKKALELYYGSNFYLARNLFAEAVKECPSDLVARWYLFRCEKMLDDGNSEQFKFGLLSK